MWRLFSLKNLHELYLYDNDLSGTLSDRIGDLESLERLHLSHNSFTGSIPISMASTAELLRPYVYINLKSNQLSGELPSGLNWKNLWYLDLGGNLLEGPLPADIHNMPSVRHLYLDHNQFNGTLLKTVLDSIVQTYPHIEFTYQIGELQNSIGIRLKSTSRLMFSDHEESQVILHIS